MRGDYLHPVRIVIEGDMEETLTVLAGSRCPKKPRTSSERRPTNLRA
jgi:hypothetical protein